MTNSLLTSKHQPDRMDVRVVGGPSTARTCAVANTEVATCRIIVPADRRDLRPGLADSDEAYTTEPGNGVYEFENGCFSACPRLDPARHFSSGWVRDLTAETCKMGVSPDIEETRTTSNQLIVS